MIADAGPTPTSIDAPYEVVRDLIRSTFEVPARYTAERLLCRTNKRGDDWLRRNILWPAGGGRSEAQTLSWSETDQAFEVEQRLGSEQAFAGRLRLRRNENNAEGSLIVLNAEAGVGNSIFGEPKASSVEEIAKRILTSLRERASPPPWVTHFYQVLDRLDADAFTALMCDDCEFRSNAGKPLIGAAQIRDDSLARWPRYKAVSHHLVSAITDGDTSAVECRTSYQRSSDLSWVTMPAAVFIERDGEAISSIRVSVENSLFSVTHPV